MGKFQSQWSTDGQKMGRKDREACLIPRFKNSVWPGEMDQCLRALAPDPPRCGLERWVNV